jgi:hypothetical protein
LAGNSRQNPAKIGEKQDFSSGKSEKFVIFREKSGGYAGKKILQGKMSRASFTAFLSENTIFTRVYVRNFFFLQKLKKSGFRAGAYARQKTLHGGSCPLCKNPPIYTVLNAAFSAPHPPLGGTSERELTPEGSRGVPPPPGTPCPSAVPTARSPSAFQHVALADDTILNLYTFFYVYIVNIWHKHADCADRKYGVKTPIFVPCGIA